MIDPTIDIITRMDPGPERDAELRVLHDRLLDAGEPLLAEALLGWLDSQPVSPECLARMATMRAGIETARIGYKDQDGSGTTQAHLLPFSNVLNQARMLACDGRRWFYQHSKLRPFQLVSASWVPAPERRVMFWFLIARWLRQRPA